MMGGILRNQRNVFIAISTSIVTVMMIWYYWFHKDIAFEHENVKRMQKSFLNKKNKYKQLESEILTIDNEWKTLNEEFETVIRRIPNKSSFDKVSNTLYLMLQDYGLENIKFTVSRIAIDKKTIILPETNNEVVIEKIPIDIEVNGGYLNFGKFLESMMNSRYRLTASHIEIAQHKKGKHKIKFIAYTYFQSLTGNSSKNLAINEIPKPKDQKPVTQKIERPEDAPEDVPDEWFKPATEPIVESIPTQKSKAKTQKKTKKKISAQKSDKIITNQKKSKEPSPDPTGKIAKIILKQLNQSPYMLDDLQFIIDDYDHNYGDVIQLLLKNNTIAYNENKELYIVEEE